MRVTHQSITNHYTYLQEMYGGKDVTAEAQILLSFSIQHLHLMVDLVSAMEDKQAERDREEDLKDIISQVLLV